MRTSAFLYPWDVVGDPDAAPRLAELGLDQITLASAYHSTRALTSRHPDRRIVTARHSAVYYPPGPWHGQRLRPYRQGWVDAADPFDAACTALRAAGLDVHSWVVLAHNSRLGEEHPDCTVLNAYGDRYPWALCVAQPEVVEYGALLAAEAAVRPGAGGVELESCGWYGLAHLHAHDKIGGVPLGPVGQLLMSLCFCPTCSAGYADAAALRAAALAALAPLWRGAPDPADLAEAVGPSLASDALAHRLAAAREFQQAAVAAVREAAPPGFRILLHADPIPHHVGPNPGVEVDRLLGQVDGLVIPAALLPAARAADLSRRPGDPPRRPGAVVAANIGILGGFGPVPEADELRFHHAGIASDADLDAVRRLLRR
ncbi:hypothetical protein KCMC57_up53660 [Kitasatospora sp. CMC57]|uniref:Alanine-rich protein n=1 Tax=Kitasatospora sp. CMC57 TaxID=3231513 RepID=A0AB33KC71_9ACTN